MDATISKWGNSQGVRFPKEIMKALKLHIGDRVDISLENETMVIKPLKKKQYDLDTLVAQVPKDYKPHEEISDVQGKEIW
ncbi:MAG: AbrB/MazE/SpoVT family DNA-binding domain-containing protein [Campylobacterota bacterium]